jgi:Cu(I)/Ag(I) efflux system membrane protein CusA/SilA
MPGVTNIWTQPIRNRIDMLSTGIRTQVGVKVFGTDLTAIEKKSAEIERVLHGVPGAVDLYTEKITGAPYVEIHVNRTAAARYGISVGDVQDVIETAIGGKNSTFTIEGRQRFPVRVRYARDFREDLEGLRNVLVAAPSGTQIPLGQIAGIRIVTTRFASSTNPSGAANMKIKSGRRRGSRSSFRLCSLSSSYCSI